MASWPKGLEISSINFSKDLMTSTSVVTSTEQSTHTNLDGGRNATLLRAALFIRDPHIRI
jgi:hypothetical protein